MPADDLIRNSANRFAEREQNLQDLRRLRRSLPGIDETKWQRAAELGFPGVLVPEAYGGLGLRFRDMADILEELGCALLADGLVAVGVLAARTLVHGHNEALKQRLLPPLCAGEARYALAWQERVADRDPARIETRCVERDGRQRLSGRKRFVAGSGGARGYLVTARTSDGVTIGYVQADAPGLTVRYEWRADGTPSGVLELDDVAIGPASIVASGAQGVAILERVLDEATVMAVAETLGVMNRAFDLTLDYLRTRVQFGRPLGSFQVLQHKMADLYIDRAVAGAVHAEAVAALDADCDATQRALIVSRAKSRCAEVGTRVTREGVQLHGAMGFTDECDIGLYFKRMVVLNAWLGTPEVHRRRFSSLRGGGLKQASAVQTPTAGQQEGLARMQALPVSARNWNALDDDTFAACAAHMFRTLLPAALRLMPRRPLWSEVKPWYEALSRAGWLAPAWPVAFGGMGLDQAKMLVYFEQMGRSGAPRHLEQGINYIGPLLIARGTEAQKAYYLPRILSGEHIWCQGYSEPGAGSDLASLSTRAVRDGEDFVINGRKIWTTMAHQATHMYALVRTGATEDRHGGISMLILDMASPGVTVRPIRNLKGHDEFCEVTLDDVRTPATNLVGDEHDGWRVSRTLLGFERNTTGSPRTCFAALDRLERVLRLPDLDPAPSVRERVDRAWMDVLDFASLYERFVQGVREGASPGPEANVLKTCATENLQRLTELTVEILGDAGAIEGAQSFDGVEMDVLMPFLDARSTTISAGSSQIQRNIIAKRVLKL